MAYIGYGYGYGMVKSTLPSSLVLWLDATFGKTIATGVSNWLDRTNYSNDAVQGTAGAQPVDNNTYLTFDGGDNFDCGNGASLNITGSLSIEAKFKTTSATDFKGFVDKYIAGTGGYVFFIGTGAAGYKVNITASLSKSMAHTVASTSNVNNNAIRTAKATIEMTRKFRKHTTSLFNGEEPEIIKEGGVYYCFYDNGTNIYRRSSTSHLFEDSVETLVLSSARYCNIWKDGSTYRLLYTDAASHNIRLATSSTLTGTYTDLGVLVTYGDAYDASLVADPHEVKIGSTYYLYYSAFPSASVGTIAYATSATGAVGSYTKNGTCLGNGAVGEFDLTLCADPNVSLLPDNLTYIIFYTGYNATLLKQQQGYATSTDGITWTKFSGNPIHFFTNQSYEVGTYGPNEPSALYENGVWRIWYRCNTTSSKVGYMEFDADPVTYLPICGNETITTKIYVDGVLETTNTKTGATGIDYIVNTSDTMKIAGDGTSTNKFIGDIYYIKVANNTNI